MSFAVDRRLALKALVMVAVATVAVFALSDGPPPGFTGSFDQPNCTVCHFSYPVDSGRDLGGSFDLLDVPEQYTPGATYTITVQLAQPGQQRWGFELAARFQDTGDQAGTITLLDPDNTQIQDLNGVQYVMQTGLGTYAGTADGPVQWQFNWTAPAEGIVVFGAAGNAADYDGTAEGDYIYTTALCSVPAEAGDQP